MMATVSAALFVASLAMFWPGVAMYDTVRQYVQVLSGGYDDWHPPAMARLWAVVAPLGPGAAPMLVLQLAAYWAGFGLIAAAQVTRRRAVAVLAVGAFPVFLGWQGVVLKDAQMASALLAAVGIVGWWRLRGRRVPVLGWVAVVLLAGYAVLIRANAVFAVVPLLVMLAPRPVRAVPKLAVGIAAVAGVLALSPVLNHRVMRAGASGVERTQALYDLAGIAVRVAPDDVGLTADEVAVLASRHCVKPFFWDPLGDASHCEAAMARVRAMPVGALYALLARAVVRHPVAYAAHRLAHLNSTERWLVPRSWPNAAPPGVSEPNTMGLGSPGVVARSWQAIAAMLVETPLGWPIAWLVVAVTALAVALARPAGAAREMAVALLMSAIVLEASFGVLSIASDLRYHLWPMIATALAVVVIAGARPARRTIGAGGAVLLAVVASGIAARIVLPPPPPTYAGMLG